LRNSELVNATLGSIEIDDVGRRWIHVVGKGGKAGKGSAASAGVGDAKPLLGPKAFADRPEPLGPGDAAHRHVGRRSDAGITSARL